MAALITKWLNTCDLSVKIVTSELESQFANGYRVGELLCTEYHAKRLKLMDAADFSRFVDSDNRSAAINNFLLLQPILRSMQIALPVDQVRRVVIEERGAALDLLFKIRLALSRHDGKFPRVKVRKFEASVFNIHRDEKPPKPLWTRATDLYDTIVDPKNTVAERDMAIHLHHFEESQNAWEEHCANMEVQEILEKREAMKVRKEFEISKMKEKVEFSKKWEQEQIDRWSATQKRQVTNNRIDLMYELSAVEKMRRKQALRTKRAEIELDYGVNWFERNRKRLGVGGDDDDDDDGGASGDNGNEDGKGPGGKEEGRTVGVDRITPLEHLTRIEAKTASELKTLAVPARNYMKRLHERAEEEKQNRKDRGARKRKQALDQRNAQRDAEMGKHKAALLKAVVATSKSEREDAGSKWEARHKKSIFEETLVAKRAARDAHRTAKLDAYFNELSIKSRSIAEEHAEKDKTLRAKLRSDLKERRNAKHQERTKWIGGGIVVNLVELALLVAKRKADELFLGREGVISRKEWRIMREGFVSGQDPREYKLWGPRSALGNEGSSRGPQESDSSKGIEPLINSLLDEAECDDFIMGKGEWTQHKVSDGGSSEKKEVDETANNMERIGNLLNSLCKPLLAPEPDPLHSDQPSVGIAMLGAPSVLGKSTLAQELALRRHLRIISEATTLQLASSVSAQTLGESELEFWGDSCVEAFNALAADMQDAGQEDPPRPPSSELISKAIVLQAKRVSSQPPGTSGGWLLLGWPTTLDQAKLLEFELEGPMTGGASYEKAVGPKSKWKPPPPEEAKSVLGCVFEVLPAEIDSESKETTEANSEEESNAENMDAASLEKVDEEWAASRSLLLETWFVDRCRQETIKNCATSCENLPSRALLDADDTYKTLVLSSLESQKETMDGVEDASGMKSEEVEPEATENDQGQATESDPKSILTLMECRNIQQLLVEATIKRGDDPFESGAFSIIDRSVVQTMWDRWVGNEFAFNDSVLPVFRMLRASSDQFNKLWAGARARCLRRLADSSASERTLEVFNAHLREVARSSSVPPESQKNFREQLLEEMEEVIDALYSITSEKQRDAENLHTTLSNSNWSSEQFKTVDKALEILVTAYSKRISSVMQLISQFFSDVDAPFRKAGYLLSEEPAGSDNSGSKDTDEEIPEASPSALPSDIVSDGPTSQSRRKTRSSNDDFVNATSRDANADFGQISLDNLRKVHADSLKDLSDTLPSFVAAGRAALWQSDGSAKDESKKQNEPGSFLENQILEQLRKSVGTFLATIIAKGHEYVERCRTKSSTILSELDDWIGKVVAAETASVGAMRKSMQTSIASVLGSKMESAKGTRSGSRNDVFSKSATEPMQVAMRYGVDIPEDGPATAVFDARCSDSSLRSRRSYLPSLHSLRTMIQTLRNVAGEVSGGDGRNITITKMLPRQKFVDALYRLASSGQIADAWLPLSRTKFLQIAQLFDPSSSGAINWCEFALTALFAYLPREGGLPDVSALRKMYSSFVRADDMSPTQSSAAIVEWNEYCSVQLWFESDERVPEEVAWQFRELIWLIFSQNVSAESRGQLPYPEVVLALAQDPRQGFGTQRSIGIFKAWHIQCAMSQCRGGRLHTNGLRNLLLCGVGSPQLSESTVVDLIRRSFDCLDDDIDTEKEISFSRFAGTLDEFRNKIPAIPFAMKDMFTCLRGTACM